MPGIPAEIEAVLSGASRFAVICARWQDILSLLPDRCIDVSITDPPYSKEVHARSIRRTYLPDTKDQPCRKTRKFEFGFDPITPEEQREFAAQAKRIVKRWTLVFSDTETAHSWRTELTGAGLDFIRYGFWVKDRAMPQITGDRPGSRVEQITIAHPKGKKRWNGGGLGNVWQHPVVVNCNGHRSDRVHPAQKPESLLLQLTDLFTEPDDIEIDPYGGSGTHGVAALKLGRRCILIEKDEAHAALCHDRLSAELDGSTLHDRRAGQVAMFGAK